MSILQAVLEALESLAANKLRSSLTILGIVIGVASVIAMVSLGRGVQASVNSQLAGTGANQLTIFSSPDPGIRNPQPLTMEDAQAITDQLADSGVLAVSGYVQGSGTTSYGSKSSSGSIYGVTANFASINNLKLVEGSFIVEEQIYGQSAVAVLGPRLAKKLFDRERGITGELVRVEGQPYRVIGVLESKGGGGFSMTSTDDALIVPITTARLRLAPRPTRSSVDALTVAVARADQVNKAADAVKQVLRIRHRTPIGLDDFYIFIAKDILDALNQVTGVLTIFLGGVAAISLLVGGIGIMNIMLVSVTERTREIGLRKALGARKRDILVQFLVESALLSLFGGLIGILLGWLIGVVVGQIAAANQAAIQAQVGLDAVLLATLFSSAIGIFFGFYPASRAARLTPVEALRSE
jgi:putative ABC transport system permease protein